MFPDDSRARARMLLERHFPALPAAVSDGFLGALKRVVFEAQKTVVKEGQAADSMFFVEEGRLNVVRQFEGGEVRPVAQLESGDVFGEIGLLSGAPRLATVITTDRCVLWRLDRTGMEAVVERHREVEKVLEDFYRERLVGNVLRTNLLFNNLTPEDQQQIARAFKVRNAAPGEVLVQYGQQPEALFVLLRGRCRPFVPQPGGRETNYPEMREGDVFGELSLLLGRPVSATVRAESRCTLLYFPRADFDRVVSVHPKLRSELMRMSFERLQRSARLLSGRLSPPGDRRV